MNHRICAVLSGVRGGRIRKAGALAAAIASVSGATNFARAATPDLSTGKHPLQLSMSLQGLTSLSQLGHVTISPNARPAVAPVGSPIYAFPINAPPINGFVPQVVFGLTSEQDKSGNLGFYAKASSIPAGQAASFTLPFAQAPRYDVAIFDTGSQSHLITYQNAFDFDLAGANRLGGYQQPIEGVNGTENTDISDALGVYATGFGNAAVASNQITVTPGTLRGQWNIPILSTEETSNLPNLIGAPMCAHYQTVIRNSQTRSMTVGENTYRSPNVSFQALGTAPPQNYSRLTLNIQSVNGVTADPAYIPSLDNFNNFADDPTTPGFWASLTAGATASHTAGSSGLQDFLFDTGADVSVISEDTAAAVGFYTGGENPSTFDFHVDVTGVGGGTVSVGGFYMNGLSVTTNGGPINWTHVPVLVLNIPDPRDGVGFIPGVLGMNLFTDRDLIINGGTGNPYVSISPVITEQWTDTGGGIWSDDTKWSLGRPDGADTQANFLSSITGASTITVDAPGFTVGSIKFDNANRYTIAGPGTITLLAQSTGTSAISVVSGSHTISAPMVFQSNTTIDIAPAASVLTMSAGLNAGSVAITKSGAGTVAMKYVRSGALSVNQGTVSMLADGSPAAVNTVSTLSISGGSSPAATLDLNDNDLIVASATYSDIAPKIAFARHGGAWDRPGISSSAARTSIPAIKTLAAVTGAQYLTTGQGSTFDGKSVPVGSVIVKFTYYGDANIDGKVDGADYSHIDTTFNQEHSAGNISGWFNGDFNYDNKVDGADYGLIDASFNAQLGSLRAAAEFLDGGGSTTEGSFAFDGSPGLAMVARHFEQFGQPYAATFLAAVPEPGGTLAVCGIALLPFARRRRHLAQSPR